MLDHVVIEPDCTGFHSLFSGLPISALREINILLILRHENIVELMEIAVGKSLDRSAKPILCVCVY